MPSEGQKHLYFRGEIFMKYKKLDLLNLIVALVLSVGVMTVFEGCAMQDDGTWMNCHNAQLYIFYIGIAITVLSLAYIFIRRQIVKFMIDIIVIFLAILQAIVPGYVVGLCSLYSMRCYTVLKPFSIIMGVILVLLSVIKIVSILKKK